MSLPSAEIIWFILGIAFFVVEMIMPGFVIFFFGIGAWATALILFFTPISLNVQLVIFLLTSLLSLFLLRKYIQKTFLGSKKENEVDQILASDGENAVVTDAIKPPGQGKVKYSGTSWQAVADQEIEVGTIVTILSQDGLVMKVQKVSE